MTYKPFQIFIDGIELDGWTSANLSRKKSDLTGSLNADIFFTKMPTSPVMTGVARGREITAYVGGQLAFTGILDARTGKSVQNRESNGRFASGSSPEISGDISRAITQDAYNISLSARGKTKYLVDSSHQHPTTNIQNTTNREVVEALCKNHNVTIDWRGDDVKLPIVRLRDGATVITELHRACNETAMYVYEGRRGELIVTDGRGTETGDDIILGVNILTFSATQSENDANSEITIKGQRTQKGVWGKDAVAPCFKTIKDNWVGANIPLVIQHYGDGTQENLERRGKFEADKRAAQSKTLTIDVFHVQQKSGLPWDIGMLHYVEVPPEGVFDVFECTEVTYNVDANGTLQTTLTLNPPPAASVIGGSSPAGSSLLTDTSLSLAELSSVGAARRAQMGLSAPSGGYPASWGGADLVNVVQDLVAIPVIVNSLLQDETTDEPPMKLPQTGFDT